jgi:hypothetical protein
MSATGSEVDIVTMLKKTMEGDVVRSLLAGNDTMCFTTKQYHSTRDKWIEKHTGITRQQLGLGEVDEYELKLTRKQIRMSGLAKEVGPDVWTLSDAAEAALVAPAPRGER